VASTTKSTWKLRLTEGIVILLPFLAHCGAQIHLLASLNYLNARERERGMETHTHSLFSLS